MKSIFLLSFLCLPAINSIAQSLTIVNNTNINVSYKLTASLELCDRYCSHKNTIPANTTQTIHTVDSLYWRCDQKPSQFSSFAIAGNKEVSNCGQRTTHIATSLVVNIAYTWQQDEKTRNVTVTLEPVNVTSGK